MATDVSEVLELSYFCSMKVHRSICLQLKKFIDRISKIFSAIESARPRCTSGIQALCSLHFTMDKAKLLIQHCCESSKFYLAIMAEKIVLRCERIRHALEICLSQIQNMVPPLLASKISHIVDELKGATFTIDASEGEARNILLALLRQDISASDSRKSSELMALQLAALRLHITSPLELLIEKRSIRKLLDKVREADATKKQMLRILLFLVRKYGEAIIVNQTESALAPHEQSIYLSIGLEPHLEYAKDETQNVATSISAPPKNFFLLGDSACSNSIASFGSSMKALHLQISNVSLHSSDTSSAGSDLILDIKNVKLPLMNADDLRSISFPNSHGIDFTPLPKLDALPWGSQCKVVKDVKDQLKDDKQACQSMFSNHYIKPLIRFLMVACDLCDSTALRDGAQVLLAFLSKSSTDVPPLHEDAIYMLASFLDSDITEEALAIIEVLSNQELYKTEILALGILPLLLNVLDTKSREFHMSAMRILSNLSSNSDIVYHMVYLKCIPKLAAFLADRVLAQYCITVFRNLCNSKKGRIAVAEHNLCIQLIAELLGSGAEEEQEYAVDVLLSLCNQFCECCHLVMKENTIQSLLDISLNGNARGKVISMELLQLLRHTREENGIECSVSLGSVVSSSVISSDSSDQPKRKSSSFKAVGYLGRKSSRLFRLIR